MHFVFRHILRHATLARRSTGTKLDRLVIDQVIEDNSSSARFAHP